MPASRTVNSVCSSSGSASAAAAAAGAAATAAAALMPYVSSMAFTNSTMSSRLQSLTASTTSFGLVLVAAIECSSLRGLGAALQLFLVGLEHADDLLQRGLDGRNELRDGALHGAQHLGQQDLARGQVRRLPDLVGGHDPALHQAADDLEADPGLPRELAQH